MPVTVVGTTLLVVVLLATHGVLAQRPQYQNASSFIYYLPDATMVSVQQSLAVASLDFDEPLYLNNALLCPASSQSCAPFASLGCRACDWSTPVDSDGGYCPGGAVASDCCGPASSPESNTPANLQAWCSPSQPVLAIDQTSSPFARSPASPSASSNVRSRYSRLVQLNATGDSAVFRFFLDPQTNWCAPVRLIVHHAAGSTELWYSARYAEPDASQFDWLSAGTIAGFGYAQTYADLCPNFHPRYTMGTVAVTVRAAEAGTAFYLELAIGDAQPLPPPSPPLSYTCANVPPSAGRSCVDEGVSLPLQFGADDVNLIQLVLPVPAGCHTLGVVVFPAVDDSLAQSTDVDLFCGRVNSAADPSISNALGARYRVGPDALTFAVCSDVDWLLDCAVQPWVGGSSTFEWSIRAPVIRTPVVDLSPYDYGVLTGLSAVQLAFFDSPTDTTCVDWYGACNTNWASYPVADPMPFYPPQALPQTPFGSVPIDGPEPYLLNVVATPEPNRLLLVVAFSSPLVAVPFDQVDFRALSSIVVSYVTGATGLPVAFPSSSSSSSSLPPAAAGFAALAVSQLQRLDIAELCVPANYSLMRDRMDALIDSIADTASLDALLTQRYDLDSYAVSLTYRSCLQRVRALLLASNASAPQLQRTCVWDADSQPLQFENDPCCNSDVVALSCCGEQLVQATIVDYQPPALDAVRGSCQEARCSLSYLDEFAAGLDALAADLCRDPSAASTEQLFTDAAWQIRHCRNLVGIGEDFTGVACLRDADCPFAPYRCDDDERRCALPPLAVTEDAFLRCFVDTLSVSFEDYLRREILPPSLAPYNKSTPQFLAAVRSAAAVPDCVGRTALEFDQRSRDVFVSSNPSCQQQYSADCPLPVCLDALCFVPPDQCLRYCQASWQRATDAAANASQCDALPAVCNVASGCNDATPRCVYCPPDPAEPCQTFAGSPTDADACAAATACLLPDGQLVFGLSAADCQALPGQCSEDCLGSECRSARGNVAGACFFTPTTPGACAATPLPSQPFESLCAASGEDVTATACAAAGGDWQSCQALGVGSCDASSTSEQRYLQCYVSAWRRCDDAAQCQQTGGCSDRAYSEFIAYDATAGAVDYRLGGCFTSGYFQNWIADETTECLADEQRVPNGCLQPAVATPAQCTPRDNQPTGTVSWRAWMTPATTRDQCLDVSQPTRAGCVFIRENRTLWYNATACADCGGEFSTAWRWSPGVWLTPQPRPLTWLTPSAQRVYTWQTDAVSFFTVNDWLQQFVGYRASFSVRSEALCSNGLISTALDALVCACAEQNTGCYRLLSVTGLIGIVSPCVGSPLLVTPPGARLSFAADSVQSGCTQISVNQVSAGSLRVPPVPPSVSFQLAKRRRYAGVVVNEYERRVGVLNGNGYIFDNVDGVDGFELCLATLPADATADANPLYDQPDFGESRDNYQTVVPLGLAIEQRLIGTTLYWCTNVTISSTSSSSRNFFPVLRRADYADYHPSELDEYEEALIYTLGALYLCVFGLVFSHAVYVLYAKITMGGAFSHYSFVIPDFLLVCTFRIVYIFAYPSDVWENQPVANFIIFEIPTFFFFSAFLIVLGIFFNALTALRPDLTRRFRYCLYAALALMWSLFISVAIAAGVIGSGGSSNCPGRVADSNEAEVQIRNLSIAYQSIVITFTFLYACAFLLTAYLLVKRVSGAQKSVRRAIRVMKDMLLSTLTMVCGFLARSTLFIIVLALQLESTIYMFITLFFTEIVVITVVELMWIRLSLAPHIASSMSSGSAAAPTQGASEYSQPEPEREPLPED